MTFAALDLTASRTMRVAAPTADVFPLLCPVRERDWIPGWEADVLHSRSGLAELGCVFVTRPSEGTMRDLGEHLLAQPLRPQDLPLLLA